MAQKRMFAKNIIETDAFMDMPMPTKALYFLLGMEADDEGFVSPNRVMRLYGGNADDLKVLIAKKFVLQFESGVVVITDWQENNYLDKNRIKETRYKGEKALLALSDNKYSMLNKSLTDVQPMFNQSRVEERRIEENRVEESGVDIAVSDDTDGITKIITSLVEINPLLGYGNKTQRKACSDLLGKFGLEKVLNTITYYKTIQGDKYAPVITTPCQLRDKMAQLVLYYEKNKQSFENNIVNI